MTKVHRLCFSSLFLGLFTVLAACHYDENELIKDDKVAFSPSKQVVFLFFVRSVSRS